MSLRERRLIRRLRNRDEKAFREMVEEYRDRVFSLSLRMLSNREEAEDVAQEVFITVFKSVENFRGESKFSTWLYRITANHCKNRIKYLARRQDRNQSEYLDDVGVQSAESGMTSSAAPAAPDAQVAGAQLGAELERAIASLEEEQRILVVLRDIEDLSYDEIGQITDLPVGTVKSKLHRARLVLRRRLQRSVEK